MSNERERLTIGDIAVTYQQGAIRSNSQLGIGEIKYLKMQDLDGNGGYSYSDLAVTEATSEEIESYKLRKGDFLINVRNSREIVGKTCVINAIPDNTIFNHMLVRIGFKKNVSSVFVNARFNTSFFKRKLDGVKAGTTTIIALYQRDLYGLPILLPSYEEQLKIAKILSTIDDKIEVNNKINSELEAMAKEIYDYWFVQFDFPDENGKPYKSSGGKMVWNEELKREIPEGWSVENIGNVADLYQPKTLSGNDLMDDGKYLVYGANGIVGRYNEFNHKENEIAVCCRGASCGCFLMTLPEAWITGNAMVITPNSEKVTKEYLYFGLSYDRIAPFITGSAQPQITRTNLETLKIIVPDKNILNRFNSFTTGVRKKLQNVQYQSNNLSELRDFLLPMLMNGQVTVK